MKSVHNRSKTRSSRSVAAKQRAAPKGDGRRAAARAPAVASPRLPRVPKGRRAQFFGEPGVDQLFGIVTALTAELSVAFERIETLERILEKRGALRRSELEAWIPDAAEAGARSAAREALIERVFQVLEAYAEPPSPLTD